MVCDKAYALWFSLPEYCTLPDKMMKNSRQTGHTKRLKIVGHRGARGLAPENTLAALRKALEHGVDEIEIDVRVTKDNVVVLHHNRDVQDPTTARLDIRHHTYAELKQHKPDLATLDEAINAINRRAPLQIEVKWGEATKPVIDILQTYLSKGWHENDFLVGSKKQQTLLEIHRGVPAIPTVVIEAFSGVRATYRARQIGTKRISMRSWWLWWYFIHAMARGGYELYAYTLDNPAKARRWLKHGLSGVITDRPDLYQ